MLRYIPVLLTLTQVACSTPGTTQPTSDDAKMARAFIEKVEKDPLYKMGFRDAVGSQIAAEPLDALVLLRGSLELLQRGTPEERRKSARFLGRLGSRSAILPLVKTLDDPDEELRETICYALQWLDAKGEPADSALVRLRREDPSVDVRVAAARTLNRPTDEETLAAYRLGLKSTRYGSVREICEDKLEKMGKLELPLPENVYTQISNEQYEEIKADRWYKIRREVKKGDTIYFEAVERPRHVPAITNWFRVKLERAGADGKSRTKAQQMKDNSLSLKGHARIVHCIDFSPDGKQLASGSEDQTVRVWDLSTGKALYVLKGHTGAVLRVIFSHDGKRLASAGLDGDGENLGRFDWKGAAQSPRTDKLRY
jgi:hypothetical protein